MRLVRCYIQGFGVLHEVEYDFSAGLSCFVSDNGSGKTTLAAFIRAMLYGIGDTRKQSLDENPRKKYFPWSGGGFGGSLTIELADKQYTIERLFGAKASEDIFTLRDTVSGQVSDRYGANIGEEILGIDEEGFVRTVFLGEGASHQIRHNPSVASRLSDAVGSDGDVGDYDGAIKRLDEGRKFYQKRGGSGEIAELAATISGIRAALDDIEREKERMRLLEGELAGLEAQRESRRQARLLLEERLGEIGREKERAAHERIYRERLENLEGERRLLNSKREAFGETIPTVDEIENMRESWSEGRRLRSEVEHSGGGDDYLRLSRLFAPGTSFEELANVEKGARELDYDRGAAEEIREKRDSESKRMAELFPAKLPTEEEIKEHLQLTKRRRVGPGLLPMIFGVLVAIIGVVTGILVNPVMYVFVGTGIALVVLGTSVNASSERKRRDRVIAFLASLGVRCEGELSELLEGKLKDLEEYLEIDKRRNERLTLLDKRIAEQSALLGDFLGRFTPPESTELVDYVRWLSSEYAKFYALSTAMEGEETREEKLKRAETLMDKARDFVARYGITEGDPFLKLRTMVEQFTFLSMTVERLEKECEEYRLQYGISGETIPSADEGDTLAKIRECEGGLRAIEAEIAVKRREYDEVCRNISVYDELEQRHRALTEKKARYERNLLLIKRTMELLTEARDRMTAKYLGKTRERFLYYEEAISDSRGDFSVSNSFTLTVNERGAGRSEESYSRGIRDLYTLAMQMALTDAMYPEERPFLILDDPFVAFDDERLERGKALLKSLAKERQIIYFTCSEARRI